MADDNKQNTDASQAPADPFASFTTEAFSDGQAVEPPKAEKPADKPGEKAQSVPHISEDSGEDDPLAAFSDQGDDDDKLQSDDKGSGDEFDGAGDDDERSRADADDDSGEDEDEDAEAAADQEGEEASRNKVPLKKRLSQLTAARRRAERENAELKRRLAEVEQGSAPKNNDQGGEGEGAEKPDKKAEKPLTDAEGNTLEKPDPNKYTYGEVDPDYINDVVNYNVETRMAKERQANEQRQAQAAEQQQAQELRQKWNDISDQGAEKYDDFEEVVLEPAKRGEFPLTKDMAVEIGESDVATDIVYHLARNPKEAQKVAGMEPRALARYIGRLEAAIQTREKQRDKGERRMTNASPPPNRRPRGAGGQFVSKAASTDFSEFEKQAMASQDRKR